MSQQASNHDVLLVFLCWGNSFVPVEKSSFSIINNDLRQSVLVSLATTQTGDLSTLTPKTNFSKGVILSANFAFISKGTS